MKKWPNLRVYIAGTIGFIACPCHLPLTLPLLLALIAGTAIGGWLANNRPVIYMASNTFFVGGLFVSARWFLGDKARSRQTGTEQKGS